MTREKRLTVVFIILSKSIDLIIVAFCHVVVAVVRSIQVGLDRSSGSDSCEEEKKDDDDDDDDEILCCYHDECCGWWCKGEIRCGDEVDDA